MKLLIDENLSPALAHSANHIGIPAQAARDVGLTGAADIRIWRHAWENDQTVVTANVGDFLILADRYDLHPGVIAMRESGLSRIEQWERLARALDWVSREADGDLINRVLEVVTLEELRLHQIPPPLGPSKV